MRSLLTAASKPLALRPRQSPKSAEPRSTTRSRTYEHRCEQRWPRKYYRMYWLCERYAGRTLWLEVYYSSNIRTEIKINIDLIAATLNLSSRSNCPLLISGGIARYAHLFNSQCSAHCYRQLHRSCGPHTRCARAPTSSISISRSRSRNVSSSMSPARCSRTSSARPAAMAASTTLK